MACLLKNGTDQWKPSYTLMQKCMVMLITPEEIFWKSETEGLLKEYL